MWRSIRPLAWLLASAAAAALGCAPKTPPIDVGREVGRPTGYELLERLEQRGSDTSDFEHVDGEVDPADVVSLDLLQGPHHVVRSARLGDRLLYTFVVDSELGELEVTGRGLLHKRVLEIEALAAYDARDLNGAQIFALDLANGVEEPIEGTLQILRHPVRTVTNVPRGVAASYKSIRQMTRGGRTHVEDDYAKEMIGLGAEKRVWAERIGVDPYSTNPWVQARLERNGWVSFASDLTIFAATIPVPAGGAAIALSAVGATTSMNEQLADEAPEDTRVRTREFLTGTLGADPELAETFLAHPWYPPTRQDTILRALARLDGVGGRARFIEMATRADEAHEAFAFTRLALMFAEAHGRRAPLAEIFVANDLLAGRTRSGRIVVPLYVDHLPWTERVAEVETGLRSVAGVGETARPVLLVSGDVSPAAEHALDARGWQVTQRLEGRWLAGLDLARHEPAGRDAARILPELGGWASHTTWRIAAHREATARATAEAVAMQTSDAEEAEAWEEARSDEVAAPDDFEARHARVEATPLVRHARLAGAPEASGAE